jgi:hypothetical protein
MHHSSQGPVTEDRMLSRRKAVKGGLAAAAGAVATLMAARTGTAAVTPLDVKRGGFTIHSTRPTTSTQSTGTETSGE